MNDSNQIQEKPSTDQSEEKLFRQWYRFIEDHGFTWKGILSRYNGNGSLDQVLDSTRRFTPLADASQLEHYLCFINQDDPSKVQENTWIIEKCGPGISHPIDLSSTTMFSSKSSGVMSRPLRKDQANFSEIYLFQGNRRISVVISYLPDPSKDSENRCVLSRISLFREVKLDLVPFPWSNQTPEVSNRDYPSIKAIDTLVLRSGTFDEIPLPDYPTHWPKDGRLIFDFPDGISINVPETLEPGNDSTLIVSWKYSTDRIKRGIANFTDDTRAADLITQECVIV
ncbi:hypothetical protein BJP34_15130 [Moorena producens PAL-8-15-08-1]|uniref:DUF3598 domain-containing protein n=1 Tax=Moorena producens PAL-8-15-08-1 TaxID=1458985 RepID=A0A1D8TSJ9_9CYAN|nr:DUF3598 family protein [Moorena producens]AOX00597.1 hypothetical protein BJP34_15130 [Moorena producens PAL-8-15-08-1]